MVTVEKQPDGTYTITGLSREDLEEIAEGLDTDDIFDFSGDSPVADAINDELFAERLNAQMP